MAVSLVSRPVAELVGTAEIAAMIGVTQQRVHQLKRQPDFPEPLAVLTGITIWRRADVEEWARRTGRLPAEEDRP